MSRISSSFRNSTPADDEDDDDGEVCGWEMARMDEDEDEDEDEDGDEDDDDVEDVEDDGRGVE